MMENRREYIVLLCLLTVLGAKARTAQINLVGSNVILVPKYTTDLKEIKWKINNIMVVDVKLNPLSSITFTLPKDRVTINDTSGALTIRNLNIMDSGRYTSEVVLSDGTYGRTDLLLSVRVPRTINKMEGDYVILEPDYTGDPSAMKWTLNGNRLVDIEMKPRGKVVYNRLQHRATISDTDGSLTIWILTIEDSGVYKAEVTVDNVIQETGINLIVSAQTKHIKLVGSDVILVPKYTTDLTEITWRINNNVAVEMKLNPLREHTFKLPKDRVTINGTNGALTIRNLNITDSGIYTADAVLRNGTVDSTDVSLSVHVPHTINKTEGSDVTLVPHYTGDPSAMKWTMNGNRLVDIEMKPRGDVVFHRLQERATITPTDGSLIIRDLTIEDSGMYKAEVTVDNVIQETGINVIVSRNKGLRICRNELTVISVGVVLFVLLYIL